MARDTFQLCPPRAGLAISQAAARVLGRSSLELHPQESH